MTSGPVEPDDYDEPVPDASEQLDVEDTSYTLEDDELRDPLDRGIDAPDRWSSAERYGTTDEEQRDGESLDQHLAEEEPDPVLAEINDDPVPPRARFIPAHESPERAAVTVTDEDADRAAVQHDGRPEETLDEAERAQAEDLASEASETDG